MIRIALAVVSIAVLTMPTQGGAGTRPAIVLTGGSGDYVYDPVVSIVATNMPAPGLGGWDIRISFDPTALAGEECDGEAGSVCDYSFRPDEARVVGASAAGFEGDVLLAELTVSCRRAGTTRLRTATVVLVDSTTGPSPPQIDADLPDGRVTCVPLPRPCGPPGPPEVCDVNCDHLANPVDSLLILQRVAGRLAVLQCDAYADVNGDGVIEAVDAALILQYVAGYFPLPPYVP
jgi:hypothetical protein